MKVTAVVQGGMRVLVFADRFAFHPSLLATPAAEDSDGLTLVVTPRDFAAWGAILVGLSTVTSAEASVAAVHVAQGAGTRLGPLLRVTPTSSPASPVAAADVGSPTPATTG